MHTCASQCPFGNNRATVALLTESVVDRYHAGVWDGMVASARESGVNLLCIVGGSLAHSPYDPWETQRNIAYRMASPAIADALVMTSSLANFISETAFAEWLAPMRALPIVSIGPCVLDDIPSVCVDNRAGMRSMVDHMVGVHGRRRIAFVKGPDGNSEAMERFGAYCDALAANAIAFDPELVFPGDFTGEAGARAVETLHDRGTAFDALVAVNDLSAVGALSVLRSRCIGVPTQIAVGGFDGIDDGACESPALTTVHQPLDELGGTALSLALDALRGATVASRTVLAPRLVVRRSCGCMPRHVVGAMSDSALSGPMVAALELDLRNDRGALLSLVEPSLDHPDPQASSAARALEHLTLASLPSLPVPTRGRAESLVLEAALGLGASAVRAENRRRLSVHGSHGRLRKAVGVLANSLDLDLLLDNIARQLPPLGIRAGIVYLYDQPLGPQMSARESLVFGDDIPSSTGSASPLPMRLCTHRNRIGGEGAQAFVVIPLFFQSDKFGYVLLDTCGANLATIDTVCEEIGGALHSAILVRTVRTQADQLRAANEELMGLRAKEHEYLQMIRDELERGRRIQKGFMPERLPQPAGWDLGAAFLPAREVSGDFYDAFLLGDDQLAFLVADVSGKNIGAALFAALVHTLVRVYGERAAASGDDPFSVVPAVNQHVMQHYRQQYAGGVVYATMLFAILELSTGRLRWINAGHTRPMVVGPGGVVDELATTGPALGLTANPSFDIATRQLAPGEMVFVYTDGVTDARTHSGEFFGIERLRTLLNSAPRNSSERVEQVRSAITSFCGTEPQFDDQTMLAVGRSA